VSVLSLALGALLASAAAAEDELELSATARRVVVDDGLAVGEGDVRLRLLDGAVRAERFELALDGSSALLERGCWERPDAELCFERLELLPDGTLLLDHAVLELCSCQGQRSPWSVSALRVRADPEGSALFLGGLLRIAGCPVLPLPLGAVPLGERRAGLLAPRFGLTPDGLELGQPVYLPLGPSADLTVEPLWRQERGARLGSELRWALPRDGGGRGALVGGWDALEGSFRGLAELEHGYVDRELRSAVEGSLVSDLGYREDFELDFTRRQQGFHELRGLVGLGPFRLDHDSFQASEAAHQRLLGLSWVRPARGVGALSPTAGLALELGGGGVSALALEESWLAARGGLGLEAGRPLGPLQAEASLWGGGLIIEPLEPIPGGAGERGSIEGQAAAELRVTLPLWGDHGALRHLLRPSLVAGASVAVEDGSFGPLQPRLEALPERWIGPRLESRWLSASGVPLHLSAELPLSERGLVPGLQAWWGHGPWWGRLQGSADWQPGAPLEQGLAWLEAGRSGQALRASVGLLELQQTQRASQLSARMAWQLPWGADRWEPRARVRWALDDGAFVERHLGLYFASRCRCLGLELGASWAEDRPLPDLGLRVDLGR
jgi:hypothetical protein